MLKQFTRKIKSTLISDNYALSVALVMSIIFFIIYSSFSILKYYSLNSTAWDLGVHMQALNSALAGRDFYSSLLGESLMAQHFQPFSFIILPFYKIWQTAITLLIIQSFFVAFSGLILYDISNRILKRVHGESKLLFLFPFVITLSFFLSPFTFSPILFDFHYLALLPFFYLLAIDSFIAGRKVLHIVSLALIVSLHSNFIYVVGCLLLFELILIVSQRKHGYFLPWDPEKSLKYYLLVFVFSIVILYVYLLFASMVKGVYLGNTSISLLPGTGESGAPSTTPIGLILALFKSPHLVWDLVTANYQSKMYFFLLIIGTTGIISILYLPALIPVIPYLLYSVFSSYGPYYQLGYQYVSMIEPVLYVSAIFSAVWLMKTIPKIRHKRLQNVLKRYSIGIFVFLILGILIAIPFSPVSPPSIYHGDKLGPLPNLTDFHVTPATSLIFEIGKSLPKNACVLTQNNLEPYFPNYISVDATPYSPTVVPNLDNFTYVVIETSNFWSVYAPTIPSLFQYTNYYLQHGWYIFAESGNYSILAIQKQLISSPIFFQPIKQNINFKLLNENSNVSTGNYILNGYFYTGTLFPGKYSVNLTGMNLSADSNYTITVNSSARLNTVSNSSGIYDNFTLTEHGRISFTFTDKYLVNGIKFSISIMSRGNILDISSVHVDETWI